MAGAVFSGERKLAKAGEMLADDAALDVRGKDHPWVSRGGIKLDHGLTHFGFDVTAAVALDVGSSTGGFTDVMLKSGAARVHAIDVGYGQLDVSLRNDPRVVNREKVNARYLEASDFEEAIEFVSIDVSFISLTMILPAVAKFLRGELVALIKPQFEVRREEVGKGGIVRDPALHVRVVGDTIEWLEGSAWNVEGVVTSPITGSEGNVEFLVCARRS